MALSLLASTPNNIVQPQQLRKPNLATNISDGPLKDGRNFQESGLAPDGHSAALCLGIYIISMTFPKWFIKDDARGIDQEQWLVDHVEGLILAKEHLKEGWKKQAAIAFEEQFPRDIRKKLYVGKGKKKRFLREETTEEARERTHKRDEQLKNWLGSHWKQILARVEKSEKHVPQYLQIQEYKTSTIPRAHSARDLYLTANPHVMRDALEAARASGITDRSELQRIANEAVTAQMNQLTPEELATYVTQSDEEKELRKAERDASKANTVTTASQETSGGQRLKQLVDLEFTVQQAIRFWAEQTQTEIVVLYGGEDGTGGVRKWLMSNRDHADANNFVNTVRDRNSEAHGILKTFDDFLVEHHGIPASDSSPSCAPSASNQVTMPAKQASSSSSLDTVIPAADTMAASSADTVSSPATDAIATPSIDDPSNIDAVTPSPVNAVVSSPADSAVSLSINVGVPSPAGATIDIVALPPTSSADTVVIPLTKDVATSSTDVVATSFSVAPPTDMVALPTDVTLVGPSAKAVTPPPDDTVIIPAGDTADITGTTIAPALLSPGSDEATSAGRRGPRGRGLKRGNVGRASHNTPNGDDEAATSRPKRAKALAGVKAAVASVAPKRKAQGASALETAPKPKRARKS